MKPLVARIVTALWLPVLIIVLWQIVTALFPRPFFTEPRVIVADFIHLADLSWFAINVWPTVWLAIAGYLMGAVFGVFVGVIIGAHEFTYRGFAPLAIFFRSIPSAAIVPVILAVWGIGALSLYIAVTVAVAFQVALVTMVAVFNTPQSVVDTSRIMKLSPWKTLLILRIPAATGQILTGLQAALQVALLVAVTAETLGAGGGMGRFTSDALDTLRLSHMWISAVVLGVVGIVIHYGFSVLEKRLAPWYFGMRKSVVTR